MLYNSVPAQFIIRFARLVVPLLLASALCACAAATNSGPPTQAPNSATAALAPTALPVTAAPTPPPATPHPTPTPPAATLRASPCDAPGQLPPGDSPSGPVDVEYDEKNTTIVVNKGTRATLPDLAAALDNPDALRELSPGEWLLAANLQIDKGAELEIGGPAAHRLKLKSDAEGFVWVKALGGNLTIANTCVTSWDQAAGDVDQQLEDGRSFVLARDGARMDIRGSDLSYLGYDANESYGVAWRLEGTSGELSESKLGYNYYGMYSYEASDLVIRGNEVHHSVRYGIDPHTRSNKLLIEDNVSHHNGKHGIILAEECSDSVVRNNITYDNQMHGIVLYQESDDNVVEGNVSYNNGLQGINVNDSRDNVVRGNVIFGNAEAGIGVGQDARENTIVENQVYQNRQDGIYLYSDAEKNVIRSNIVRDNGRYGIYVKSDNNRVADDNQVSGNQKADVENAS